MAGNLFLIIFPALMIFAAFSDLLTFTIPNRVPALLVLGYFALAVYCQLPLERVAQDSLCALTTLIIGMALFGFRLIGGGDAKLAAATAFWLGWENLLSYGMFASLGGLVLTMIIVYLRFSESSSQIASGNVLARLADKNGGVPYGIALAIGGLAVFPQTRIWSCVSSGL